jgi:Mrp family chromosome partitioning ATPase
MLMRVKQAVENVGGQVIGVVLNNVDIRSDSQYQYYTSNYTYYAPSADSAPRNAKAASKAEKKTATASKQDNDLY